MGARRPAWSILPPAIEAALLMVLGAGCVALQNGMIRVVSAEIHTFEIVFFRNLFGLAAMLPFLGGVGLGMVRAHHPGQLLVMSVWHLLGMVCFFLAIVYLPLAEVIALAFSKPLFATVGAAVVLHEVVRARRWSAVALGFAGVLIVLQPGAQAISPYAVLVLLGALMGAITSLMIKRLTASEGVSTIVWYQALFATVLALPLCLLQWRMPDAQGWLLLIAIGGLGTVSWLTMTRAFFLIDASAVVPFEFLRLPFAALVAYLWFAEVPTVSTWLGGALIFGTSIYIAQREAQIARSRPAATARGPGPVTTISP
jgi:drug/metabolite transporter (DMT)-like permease